MKGEGAEELEELWRRCRQGDEASAIQSHDHVHFSNKKSPSALSTHQPIHSTARDLVLCTYTVLRLFETTIVVLEGLQLNL